MNPASNIIAIYGDNCPREAVVGDLCHFIEEVVGWARRLEISLCTTPEYQVFLKSILKPNVADYISAATCQYLSRASLALSLGGDGTFLATAAQVGDAGTPIMGVNAGHLGYLTAVDVRQYNEVIDAIEHRRYLVQSRSVLHVALPEHMQHMLTHPYALNEVAVLKRDTSSMVDVTAKLSCCPQSAVYQADGLIVSTPTGSTGYNLSAGGPLMHPMCPCMAVTPIAAHSLSMRPLVVPQSVSISITTQARSTSFMLSLDGRSITLPVGTEITVSLAPWHVNMVRMANDGGFMETLSRKLGWGI